MFLEKEQFRQCSITKITKIWLGEQKNGDVKSFLMRVKDPERSIKTQRSNRVIYIINTYPTISRTSDTYPTISRISDNNPSIYWYTLCLDLTTEFTAYPGGMFLRFTHPNWGHIRNTNPRTNPDINPPMWAKLSTCGSNPKAKLMTIMNSSVTNAANYKKKKNKLRYQSYRTPILKLPEPSVKHFIRFLLKK